MPHYMEAELGLNHSVIYLDDSGKYFRFSEGTWAWRNHNPGNLVPGHEYLRSRVGSSVNGSLNHMIVKDPKKRK